jgi:hypothetical protein
MAEPKPVHIKRRSLSIAWLLTVIVMAAIAGLGWWLIQPASTHASPGYLPKAATFSAGGVLHPTKKS